MKVEDLKKFKDNTYSNLSRDLEAFEKNFILISSGMLAFSITFIKDIVKIDDAEMLFFLYSGWAGMLIADGLMMYAFLLSVKGSNRLWKIVDDFINENELIQSEHELTLEQWKSIKEKTNTELYKVKKCLEKLRFTAILFFILGVLLFGIFVSLNLTNENAKNNESEQKKEVKIQVNETNTSCRDSLKLKSNNTK